MREFVEHLLSVSEVAEYLGIGKRTVYRFLAKKVIPATKIGHSWKFEKARIDDWMRSQRP